MKSTELRHADFPMSGLKEKAGKQSLPAPLQSRCQLKWIVHTFTLPPLNESILQVCGADRGSIKSQLQLHVSSICSADMSAEGSNALPRRCHLRSYSISGIWECARVHSRASLTGFGMPSRWHYSVQTGFPSVLKRSRCCRHHVAIPAPSLNPSSTLLIPTDCHLTLQISQGSGSSGYSWVALRSGPPQHLSCPSASTYLCHRSGIYTYMSTAHMAYAAAIACRDT